MEPLRFVYSYPRMKNLLFQVRMCKTSLMRRLKSHRLLLTQLRVIVAGSHLIFPVETTPGFNLLGHHMAFRDQPERKGNSKLSYWTYFWHLLSCSSLDTHFGDLIFPWETPISISAIFSKVGRSWILQHLLLGTALTEFSLLGFWRARLSQPQQVQLQKTHRANGLSCEKLESWEISHNVFFLTLRSQGLSDFKVEKRQDFQKGKRKKHWSHPWEEQVSHSVGVEKGLQILDIFQYQNQTHSGLWPQPSGIEEPDFTRALLKLCLKK